MKKHWIEVPAMHIEVRRDEKGEFIGKVMPSDWDYPDDAYQSLAPAYWPDGMLEVVYMLTWIDIRQSLIDAFCADNQNLQMLIDTALAEKLMRNEADAINSRRNRRQR